MQLLDHLHTSNLSETLQQYSKLRGTEAFPGLFLFSIRHLTRHLKTWSIRAAPVVLY